MSLRHKKEAAMDLLRRYKELFQYYWTNRKELGGGVFNEEEATFLPAALSLTEKPVSPTSRILSWVMIVLIGTLLLWSIIGEMDIVTNATGKIIPSDRTKTIASLDVASVRAIHVQEGQFVRKGDLLVELDATAFDAERDKAQGDRRVALLQAAKAQAMIRALKSGTAPKLEPIQGVSSEYVAEAQRALDGQYHDYLAKLQRTNSDISKFEEALPLAEQRARDYKDLLQDHAVAEHAYLEKEEAFIQLRGQLAEAKNQRSMLIAETRRQAFDALTEGDKIANSNQQDVLRADTHSRLLNLTSPINGTVQQLTVHTVGGVVPAAQPLMQIVPREGVVEVEAFVENKDIGFIVEGQKAAVKVDTFEYTKYGTIPATVINVSRDAIQDEKRGLIYSVRVALSKSAIFIDKKSEPLTAGMSVNVEIKTGTRRVIEYVLSPLLQHARESVNER